MSSVVSSRPGQKPLDSPSLSVDAIEAQLGFLLGEVLTLMDAAIVPEQQNKAAKDMVKVVFRSRAKYVRSLCGIGGMARELAAHSDK